MVTASTEEGLSAVTERYLAHEGGDPILTRASLRWSPCDSPIHKEGESLLAKSEQLRAEGPAPYEDSVEGDQAIALVFDSSVDVLRQLDSEKLFGTSAKEARVKMLIYARWSQSIHSSFLCFSDYSNSAGVLSERCTETFHSRLRDVSASK